MIDDLTTEQRRTIDALRDRQGITLDTNRPIIPATSPPTEPATAINHLFHVRDYDIHDDLTDTERTEVISLVRALGCDPDDIEARFAVSCGAAGVRLHLTEHTRDESGSKVLDLATGRAVSVPRVFDIDPARLPAAIRPAASRTEPTRED